MIAIPNATVKITKACKITSTPLKFHKALPKEELEYTPIELEIERKIAGNVKTTPAPIRATVFSGDVFFADYHLTFLLIRTGWLMCLHRRRIEKWLHKSRR